MVEKNSTYFAMEILLVISLFFLSIMKTIRIWNFIKGAHNEKQ